MIQEIETNNYPNQSYAVTLNYQSVTVDLKMNSLDGDVFWTMTLRSSSGLTLCAGRRIKSGFPILLPTIVGFEGNFLAFPISSPEEPLGVKPWGNTHVLLYSDGE